MRARGFSLGEGEAKARSQAAIEGDRRVDLRGKRRVGRPLAEERIDRGQAVVARQPEGGGVLGAHAGQPQRALGGRFDKGGVDEAGQGEEGRGAFEADFWGGTRLGKEVESHVAGLGVGRA